MKLRIYNRRLLGLLFPVEYKSFEEWLCDKDYSPDALMSASYILNNRYEKYPYSKVELGLFENEN